MPAGVNAVADGVESSVAGGVGAEQDIVSAIAGEVVRPDDRIGG
jgi:hypothetical protein